MDASLFSRSHFSFRIDECSAMSMRQMQGEQEGEDDQSRGCNVANCSQFGRLCTYKVAPSVKFSSYFTMPGETRRMLSKFRSSKPGETRSSGFERRRHAPLSSDAGGKERTTKPGETRCTKSWENISGT